MLNFRLFILVILLAASQVVLAQSKQTETTGPTSLTPYYPEKTKNVKKDSKKSKSGKVTYDARDRFYDRMEAVAKANRKAEKELQKPQYSDPSYFGHKRPPKRRPSGKLKYCKECGIRH
jgi:hypothetical protein